MRSACALCGAPDPEWEVAHTRDGAVVGWVLVCEKCRLSGAMRGVEVRIIINGEIKNAQNSAISQVLHETQ